MKRRFGRGLCLRGMIALIVWCLLASLSGGEVFAQTGRSDAGDGPATGGKVYLPLVSRPCNAIPARVVQCVDCPKDYYRMTPGSLRLDSNDHPHIAYGGDHLYHAWNDGSTWHYETVDASPGVGAYASLALDSTGKPAIAYYDSYHGNLKYARWNGSSWTLSVIDAAQYSGLGTQVLFDNGDTPLVAYVYEGSLGGYVLKLKRLNGSTWTSYQSQVAALDDLSFSMALDKTGKPSFTYYNGNLKYIHWNGSAWDTPQNADYPDPGTASYNSLAFDSAGNPHISYYDFWSVVYASRTGASTWTHEDVISRDMSEYQPTTLVFDSSDRPMIAVPFGQLLYKKSNTWYMTGGMGEYASLALDKSGRPHLSSLDTTQHQLVYSELTAWGVYPAPDTWSTVYLDTKALVVGPGVQMAVDAQGTPHIAYMDTTLPRRLKYATLVNGCWQIQTVNPYGASAPGDAIGLALDPAGKPHIAYPDVYNGRIMYASLVGTSWNLEIVTADTQGYQGTFERYLSLAIDGSGIPYISYYDGGSLSLKMAKKATSSWTVETVDGTGSSWVGNFNSIAVDSLGHPHISYMSYPNRLWYAHWTGSAWVKVKPDSVSLDSGWDSAITVDSSNRAHMCYVDGTSYDLKYAHATNDAATSWEIMTIAAGGAVQLGGDMPACSIRIGPGTAPYVSYYDSGCRAVQRAGVL